MSLDDSEDLVDPLWISFLFTVIVGLLGYRCFGPDQKRVERKKKQVHFDIKEDDVEVEHPEAISEIKEDEIVSVVAISTNAETGTVHHVISDNKEDEDSETFVIVKPTETGQVHAIGPGIATGVSNRISSFVVIGEGTFDFLIQGPSQAEIDFDNYGQGIGLVTYMPLCAGDYQVQIKRNGGDIEQTYTSTVIDQDDLDCVSVLNLDTEPFVNQPSTFDIDMNGLPHKNLEVIVAYNDQKIVNVTSTAEPENGVYHCMYIPEMMGNYYVLITLDGYSVPSSPFKITPRQKINLDEVRLIGPAVMSKTIKQNCSTFFIVDPTKTNVDEETDVSIQIKGDCGFVKTDVVRNATGTYTVKFVPEYAGVLDIKVLLYTDL